MNIDHELLECPNCIDGIVYNHDPLGDWESRCQMCDGSGMLDKNESEKLRKLRIAYYKKYPKKDKP